MTPPSPRRAIRTVDEGHTWLKSSRSGTEGGDCVEVTRGFLRDSKAPSLWLHISEGGWSSFLGSVKASPARSNADGGDSTK